MPENEEILNNIWSTLSNDPSVNLTSNNFEEWKTTFVADKNIQTNVYNHLSKNPANNLTAKNQEEWTVNVMGKTTTPSIETETAESENTASPSGDGGVEYKFQEEGGKSAWARSVDGGEWDVVDAKAIPEEWFADENFKKAYDAQNTPSEDDQRINTLLRVKNPQTGKMEINKSFFDKEEEEGVELLEAQFGDAYNFDQVRYTKQTARGRGSFNAVRISTKDGKKSQILEFNIDGMPLGNTFVDGKTLKESQPIILADAYEKSYNDLIAFMHNNKSTATEIAIQNNL